MTSEQVLIRLPFEYRGSQTVSVGLISNRTRYPIEADVEAITLLSQGWCRFEIGDCTVVADLDRSPVLMRNHYLTIPLRRGESHVAFIGEYEGFQAHVMKRG